MNPLKKPKLDELLYLELENAASPNQIEILNALIESDINIRQYVYDYYFVVTALRKPDFIDYLSDTPQ